MARQERQIHETQVREVNRVVQVYVRLTVRNILRMWNLTTDDADEGIGFLWGGDIL